MIYTDQAKLDKKTSLLGFGLMRLPLNKDGKIDRKRALAMVDRAIASGVNYFDTAYFYHDEESEDFAAEALAERYPREDFFLADKLPIWECREKGDEERLCLEQLRRLKTDYFDFYLLHAMNEERWETAKKLGIDRWMQEKKAEGRFKRIGFSFHDRPEVLDRILTEGNFDFCQIQMNYLDYEIYESKAQYEIIRRHGLPFVIMEPIRGGSLANPHQDVQALFKEVKPELSPAAAALRFAISLDGVMTVLSGMSDESHVLENIKTVSEFEGLSKKEEEMYEKAREIFRGLPLIPCTECKYCKLCPSGIEMWELFSRYNHYISYNQPERLIGYVEKCEEAHLPPACISCFQCEEQCPQHIKITEKIQDVYQLALKLKAERSPSEG